MIFKQETVKSWFSGVSASVNNEILQPFNNAEQVIWKYNQAIQYNSLTQQGWTRLLEQSDDGLKAYLTSIKGTTASMAGYNVSLQGNITGFKKVSSAITQYNTLSVSGTKEQNTFATAVSTTNGKLGTYLTGLNGAKASLGGYGVSLIASTAKTIGLTVATTALNAAMTMGISVIVTGLISAFTAWINKSEEITEKAQEAADKINSISDSLETNIETVESAKERYAELAQEVENLGKITQDKGTLSNEEYEEFLDLSNQLAEIFPQLTKGYDDNGNAILDLSGDVNTIVSSLDDLIQKEKELANQQIMEEFPDVFKGWTQDVSNAEQKVKSAQAEFDKINQAYNALGKGQSIQMAFNPLGSNTDTDGKITTIGEYESWLETLGLTYKEVNIEGGRLVTAIGDIDTAFTSKLESAREDLQYAQQQLEGETSSINQYLNTWLQTEFSYNQIKDTGLQQAVQDMLFNFDWSTLPEDIDKNDWNAVSEYLRRNILFAINNVQDNEEISKALSEIFTNTELTPDEKVNYIKQVQDYFGEDNAITISLQPTLDDTETLQKQYDNAIEKTKDKFDGYDPTAFFKEHSINTQEEIDKWLEIAQSANSATEAEKEYLEGSTSNNETDILSFSDVFNATDFANTREELLELAKSGEITASVLESTEEYKTLLDKTGLSAEEVKNKIIDTLSVQEKLAAADNGLESLSKAYEEFQDIGFVTASTLESIPDAFKDLKGFDLFSQIVGDPTQGQEAIQNAFDEIVKQYLISQNTLDGLVNASESEIQSYIANLKQMGITNAKELVNQTIAVLNEEKELINEAEEEYLTAYQNYLVNKDEADLEYLKSATSKNGQLTGILGSAYETDYNNWCELLGEKASAYNRFIEALGGSYNPDIGMAQNLLKNGITPTSFTLSEAYEAQAEYERLRMQAEELKNALKLDFSTINTDFSTSFSPSSNSSASLSDTNAAAPDPKTYNWIETALDRVKRAFEKLKAAASNVYKTFSERNFALSQEWENIRQQIELNQQAYETYMAKANAVGLSEDYAQKVRDGSISIEDIADEALQEQIDEYKEYYENALDCADAVEELKNQLSELASEQFELISSGFDSRLSLIEKHADLLNNSIDLTEAKGQLVSARYYEELAQVEQENILQLQQEKSALQSSLKEAVANGSIAEGSEEWYSMRDSILEVDLAIQDATKSLVEYENSMRELDWEVFDMVRDRVSAITEEADFLVELLSGGTLFDENGTMTRQGTAVLGLHGVNYNTYMSQADAYATELAKLDRQISSSPYDLELLERREELLELQRESIEAAEEEKQAMKDLISEGYDAFLDSLQKVIDRYKDAMQSAKDLHDYQKNIDSQTKNIASLEKQLLALRRDDSEENRAKLQQLKTSLEEAKENLAESEYEQYLSDQEQLLDELYSSYEELFNQRLDDLDGLLSDVIESTNANAETISQTISAEAASVGFALSDQMKNIWDTSNGVGKVISDYSSNFSSTMTTIQNTINGIKSSVDALVTQANQTAAADTAQANQTVTATGTSPDTENTKQFTSADSIPSPAPAPSSAWGSWFISKKDSYPKNKLNVDTSIVDRLKYRDIDSSFSARRDYYSAMGGSGTYTGSSAQNVWMLQEMKAHGYEKGSRNIPHDQLAWTQEKGSELIYRSRDKAIFTPLGAGDKVFTDEMTERLWRMAQENPVIPTALFNLPTAETALRSLPSSHLSQSIQNDVQLNIELPGVTNYSDFKTALISDKQFENVIKQISLGSALGKNSLEKYKF